MSRTGGRYLGLRWRFILLSSAILAIVFAGLTYVLVRNNSEQLKSSLTEQSKAFSALATKPIGDTFVLYKDSGRILIDKEVRELEALNKSIANITIVDLEGEIQYSFDEENASNLPSELAATFEEQYFYEDGLIKTIVSPYFEKNQSHRYTVVYDITNDEIEAAIRRETIAIMTIGIGSMLASAIGTYVFINRYILKPVANVSKQAQAISSGNLEQQILLKRRDEIGSLAESVNHMAQSLKSNIEELKEIDKVKTEFMMITSHNLRTPLTIINGYLDEIDDETDIESLKGSIKQIAASTVKLNTFAEDVLTISQMELGKSSFHTEKLILDSFLEEIADEFEPTATAKGLRFTRDIPHFGLSLPLDKPRLRTAVFNILDNAVKFTESGGMVSFSLITTAKEARIVVSDSGIGISEDEKSKLFTKFHRGTSTLTYDYEGVGIGLYSSKIMIDQLGGRIEVESELGKGSTFTIVLPLDLPAEAPATQT